MTSRRLFVVVGGPNGTGKSTFSDAYRAQGLQVLDPDAIARAEQLSDGDAWTAARDRALSALEAGEDVVVESTLAGSDPTRRSTYLNMMAQARDLGYHVSLTFICVEDVELLVARVATRHAAGLHSIPEEKIRERYDVTLNRLADTVSLADDVRIVDNTADAQSGNEFELAVEITDRKLTYLAPERPAWVERSLGPQIEHWAAHDREQTILAARKRMRNLNAPVLEADGIYAVPVLAVGASVIAVRYGGTILTATGVDPETVQVGKEVRLHARAGKCIAPDARRIERTREL